MKKLIPLFLTILLITPYALAQTYGPAPTPGVKEYYPSSYVSPAQPNNIGVTVTATMNLTIALQNLAPWSQPIIINPYYHYVVLKRESPANFGSTGEFPYWTSLPSWERRIQYFLYDFDIYGALPGDRIANDINLLTYRLIPRVGVYDFYPVIWMNPKEKIVLKLSAEYPVKLMNFQTPFPYVLNYTKKPDQLVWRYYTIANNTFPQPVIYGTVLPQLVNTPQYIINPVQMFEENKYIKVLGYNATVNINITKTYAGDVKEFRLVFAIAPPIIFPNARYVNATIDGFIPTPASATFWEFTHIILPAYTNPSALNPQTNTPATTTKVKNHLLTGIKGLLTVNVPSSLSKPKSTTKMYNPYLDFPIWIVWLEKGGISIQYYVHWDPSTQPGIPQSWHWEGSS